MIEWYDFYIFGSLAAIISGVFFPADLYFDLCGRFRRSPFRRDLLRSHRRPDRASAVVTRTYHLYAGLGYPIGVALFTFIIGSLFLHVSKDVKIWQEVETPA